MEPWPKKQEVAILPVCILRIFSSASLQGLPLPHPQPHHTEKLQRGNSYHLTDMKDGGSSAEGTCEKDGLESLRFVIVWPVSKEHLPALEHAQRGFKEFKQSFKKFKKMFKQMSEPRDGA